MKRSILTALLILGFSAHGSDTKTPQKSPCQYIDGSAAVEWTGYKTAKKVPVKGLLKKIKIKPSKGSTAQDLINGSTFEVSGAKGSVDSKNPARDIKIAKFFFGMFKGGPVIKGTVTKVTQDKIHTQLSFNGITKEILLSYTIKKGMLKATGSLDFVKQFDAKKSHTELGKACAAKHEGATGTDAGIELRASFKGC